VSDEVEPSSKIYISITGEESVTVLEPAL